MTTQEKERQLILAKATLRIAERNFNAKKGTKEQLEEAQRNFDDLKSFNVEKFEKVLKKEEAQIQRVLEQDKERFTTVANKVQSYPLEVRQMIDELVKQRDEVHYQKALISNSLKNIPKEQTAITEVQSILAYRNKWRDLNAKIRFVQQHGQLPPEENKQPDLSENLTLDSKGFEKAQEIKELYVLKQDLDNARSNLSKARKNLSKVSELGKQQHYKQKIAVLEYQVRIMSGVYEARR